MTSFVSIEFIETVRIFLENVHFNFENFVSFRKIRWLIFRFVTFKFVDHLSNVNRLKIVFFIVEIVLRFLHRFSNINIIDRRIKTIIQTVFIDANFVRSVRFRHFIWFEKQTIWVFLRQSNIFLFVSASTSTFTFENTSKM